jgi:hypothetical protein
MNYFNSAFKSDHHRNGFVSLKQAKYSINLKKIINFKTIGINNIDQILMRKSKKKSKITTLSNFMSKSDFYYDKI